MIRAEVALRFPYIDPDPARRAPHLPMHPVTPCAAPFRRDRDARAS
jgi:hypothetical protein